MSEKLLTIDGCMDALEEAIAKEARVAATNRTKSNIHIPTEDPEQPRPT